MKNKNNLQNKQLGSTKIKDFGFQEPSYTDNLSYDKFSGYFDTRRYLQMSQDIVSDVLNQIMNAKRARKKSITVHKSSKLLINILQIAKESGYIDYTLSGHELKIDIKDINHFASVKPRFTVSVKRINHYVRRYLPAKNYGFLIISTSKGLCKHSEAEEKNLGGCIIAYIY